MSPHGVGLSVLATGERKEVVSIRLKSNSIIIALLLDAFQNECTLIGQLELAPAVSF